MNFSHFNRRLHLYLGLALLPWFFMYGVSSVPFAHNSFFEQLDKKKNLPMWTLRLERPFDAPVPEDREELREFGRRLLRDVGIEGTNFGVFRANDGQLNVYSYSFWKSTQLKYFINDKRITVEDRRFRWDQFLTGMHARGGFEQDGALQDSWSVVIDVVCIAMFLWIASGFYMWWSIRGHRGWGWLAIVAGTLSFVLFTVRL